LTRKLDCTSKTTEEICYITGRIVVAERAQNTPVCRTFPNFNGLLLMVVREGKAATTDTGPKHVLGLTFASESFERFVIHTPNYCTGYGKSDLVNVSSVMLGTFHYAADVFTELLDLYQFERHDSLLRSEMRCQEMQGRDL